MKKTIFLLCLSGSVLATSAQENDSWVFENTHLGNAKEIKGLIFTLSDNARLDISQPTTYTTLPTTLQLDSITLWSRSDGTIGEGCIYITDKDNTILAFSDHNSGASSNGGSVVYNFQSTSDIFSSSTTSNCLTLSYGSTYKIFYLSGSATSIAAYSWATVGTVLDGLKQNDMALATATSATASSTNVADCGTLTGLDTLSSNTWGAQMKIVTHSIATPEPTTATLSLLALAGLITRRRRG
ncbi:MAG: PEP-CTERM sorting domain-containing protein [Akkermansia sp.]